MSCPSCHGQGRTYTADTPDYGRQTRTREAQARPPQSSRGQATPANSQVNITDIRDWGGIIIVIIGGINGYLARTGHGVTNPFVAAWQVVRAIHELAVSLGTRLSGAAESGLWAFVIKAVAFLVAVPFEILAAVGAFFGNVIAAITSMF